MKKILVTGGAGFVGRHLCLHLLKQDNFVYCLDNYYTGSKANIKELLDYKSFELIQHDIIQPIDLEVDEIYNLACPASPVYYQKDPMYTWKTCTFGVYNMVNLAMANNAKILHASTSEVYGDPTVHPQNESYWGNVNPIGIRSCYDEGKRSAETLLFDYNRIHGTPIRVVRIFNTYGPFMQPDDGRVVSNFIIQAIKGNDITVYGTGEQTRSFCYVNDMVNGLVAMMNNEKDFIGPCNLGNPSEFTIKELAEQVIEQTNTKSKIIYKPLPPDDPQKRKPDITLAKEKLNWTSSVPLKDGLKKAIDYFKSIVPMIMVLLLLLPCALMSKDKGKKTSSPKNGIIMKHLQEIDALKYDLYKAKKLYNNYDIKISKLKKMIAKSKWKITNPEHHKNIAIKHDENGEWRTFYDSKTKSTLKALVRKKK